MRNLLSAVTTRARLHKSHVARRTISNLPHRTSIQDELSSLTHLGTQTDTQASSHYDVLFRSSSAKDAVHLAVNALVERGLANDKAVVETLVRRTFEERINSIDDVRDVSLPVWSRSLFRPLNPVVHSALAIRSVEVLVASQAASLLPAAISFFLHTPRTPDLSPDPVSRHVLKEIASLPPGTPHRNHLLIQLLRAATVHRYRLDRYTYDALMYERDLNPQLVRAIENHMRCMAVKMRDGNFPAAIRAFAEGGEGARARKMLFRGKAARKARTTEEGCPEPPSEDEAGVTTPSEWPIKESIALDDIMHFRSFNDVDDLQNYIRRLSGGARFNSTGSAGNHHFLGSRGWRAYVKQLCAIPSVTGNALVELLLKMERRRIPVELDVKTYTTITNALIDRKEWYLAWNVWERLRLRCVLESQSAGHWDPSQRIWRLDRFALAVGVTLMCRHKGDFSEAFEMVHTMTSVERTSTSNSNRVLADTFLLNRLLWEFARERRVEAIFPVWQEMSRQYEVHRDNGTLTILLRAAAYGSVGGETDGTLKGVDGLANSIAGGFQKLVMASKRRKRQVAAGAEESVHPGSSSRTFHYRMTRILAEPRAPRDDVLWDGMIAWQRARLVFLEVVLGNWPGLRDVEPPAGDGRTRSFRHAANTSATSAWNQPGLADLLKPSRIHGAPYPHHIEFLKDSDPHIIPPAPSTALYPQIVPDDRTFKWYIHLLGEHSLQAQIPITLAWMRCLSVRPSKHTLAIALAYFREVTEDLKAPLMGAYGREGRGEYGRLVRWVEEWVGTLKGAEREGLIPDEDAVARSWMKAQKKREAAEWRHESDRRGDS